MSDESKLLLFLEKLECSQGMKNFKKSKSPKYGKISLIPSKDIYDKIGEIDHISGKIKVKRNINTLLKSN